MNGKTILPLMLIVMLSAILFCGCVSQPQGNQTPTATVTVTVTPTVTTTTPVSNAVYTQDEFNLSLMWRDLWEDHIIWTRMVIINIADIPGGTNESVTRLLQNYEDMGDAMRPYYGDAAANQFADLIDNHLLIAADLVKAAKANNTTAVKSLETQWYANADQIAAFQESINPNWDTNMTMQMWHDHLAATEAEAVARISKNFTADAAAFDTVHAQAVKMADSMSDGIRTQFPAKFPGPKTRTQAELDLYNAMRYLWTDHTVWTRMYIISSLANSTDAPVAAARLLKNQEDIGNAIKPLYGDAAGNNLTALLKQHILIAVDIINAVKAQNSTAQAAAEAAWTQNADQIANLLSGANPNLPNQVVKDLMYTHLSTTKDELVARYTMNYPADVAAWDIVYDHIKMMSDALSGGIIQQFPQKFGK